MKKVSIIIPCYNSEKWLEQCLLSALNQNYDNCEVIYVDNESTDKSMGIAYRLQEEYANLIIESAPNIYKNCWDEAREKGFSIATGEYFFTLASDDFLEEDYVTNVLKYMESSDLIKALQSPIKNTNEHGHMIDAGIKHFYKNEDEFKEQCMQRCPVNTPTVVFKRCLYDEGYLKTEPDKYGGAADYNLYCKLVSEGVFVFPADRHLGYCYRWHSEQATWNVHREGINYDLMIQKYWREQWKI